MSFRAIRAGRHHVYVADWIKDSGFSRPEARTRLWEAAKQDGLSLVWVVSCDLPGAIQTLGLSCSSPASCDCRDLWKSEIALDPGVEATWSLEAAKR